MREAVDTEFTALQSRVEQVSGVGYHLRALVQPESDQTNLRSVHQMPPVRHPLLPAHLLRIRPQDLHLIGRVVLVPESVSQHLARSGRGLDELQLNSGIAIGAERSRLPVGLLALLPANDVEVSVVLIGEDEAHEIVVIVVVDVKRSFEVDATELIRPFADRKGKKNERRT